MKTITAEEFRTKVGVLPTQDDLELCNCPQAGEPSHYGCGWCEFHDGPKFMCGCEVIPVQYQNDPKPL